MALGRHDFSMHTSLVQGTNDQRGDGAQGAECSSPSGACTLLQYTPVAMPWFMCSPWVPNLLLRVVDWEWRAQMEAILRLQGMREQQQIDFIMEALDGRAKRNHV